MPSFGYGEKLSVDEYFDTVVEPIVGLSSVDAEVNTKSFEGRRFSSRAVRRLLEYLGFTDDPTPDYVRPHDPLTGARRAQNVTQWGTKGSTPTVLSRISDNVRGGATTYFKSIITPNEARVSQPYAFETLTIAEVLATHASDPAMPNCIGNAALYNGGVCLTHRWCQQKLPPTFHPDELELMKLGCHLTDPNELNPNHILF